MDAPATLYDLPVSNNGARCRMVLYYKGISEDMVAIRSPMELGGLKSEEFKAISPQGLMPCLHLPSEGIALPESDTIARYLDARFAESPRLLPADPLAAAKCNRVCRLHDVYIGAIQGCMYRQPLADLNPFGRFSSRAEALDSIVEQLANLEEYADEEGPYLCGDAPTLADCTVFPTAVFWMLSLPKFDFAVEDFMGPRLSRWWRHMRETDEVGQRVYAEVNGALAGWESKGRWDSIRGAGLRDEAPDTIFDKILAKEIPSDMVYEDAHVFAFRDIAPVAPTHVLLIPKRRDGLTQLQHAAPDHRGILGHMLAVAVPAIVKTEGLDSYRLVVNDGEPSCQTVFHLHMHIIGGKELTWPPGA